MSWIQKREKAEVNDLTLKADLLHKQSSNERHAVVGFMNGKS